MDPGNLLTFNTIYFTGVMNNQGLFVADAALLNNRTTRAYVEAIYRANSPKLFFLDFALSMIHMGGIKPLIGTNGTIRAVCGSFVN
ncbi:Peroxidase [Rhynchospora pubera]|uniref:Peroxidase n=1 Tax=Rhynchospora pubera TaxID=906938 RepID=A0AAV8GZZ6_9POAL|nr:Peroxidase [Rhynchospora pubera]